MSQESILDLIVGFGKALCQVNFLNKANESIRNNIFGDQTVINAGILLLIVNVIANFIRNIYKKQIAIPAVSLYPNPPLFFLFEIKKPRIVKMKIENEYENLSCWSIW